MFENVSKPRDEKQVSAGGVSESASTHPIALMIRYPTVDTTCCIAQYHAKRFNFVGDFTHQGRNNTRGNTILEEVDVREVKLSDFVLLRRPVKTSSTFEFHCDEVMLITYAV
jgi:hypothetical protein